jgi:16S rRNA (guanine527-N7)-methyltransferase
MIAITMIAIIRKQLIYQKKMWSINNHQQMRLHQRCECVFIAAAINASSNYAHRPELERGSSLSMSSTVEPSESTIRKALSEFQIDVNAGQVVQIQKYIRLLLVWNEKVNLTAIRDPLEILYRHFCESMFATKVVELRQCRLADIGTGAGFPGLALKILVPDSQIFLVESNTKKATFLAEVIRALGMSGANVLINRYDEVGEQVAPIDFLLVRALGEFDAFLKWVAAPRVDANTVILWVGAADVEQVRTSKHWTWEPPVTVPKSLRRVLLIGRRAGV